MRPRLGASAAFLWCLVIAAALQFAGAQVMGRARFDDVTGAPLNKAAKDILARHDEGVSGPAVGAEDAFDGLRVVDVAEGTWKFVLLECELGSRRKQIVRALEGLKFHAENFDVVHSLLHPLGIHVRVIGGGRIARQESNKTISVYGYSKTFGRSPGCNERTAGIIREVLPGYEVTWSDAGY